MSRGPSGRWRSSDLARIRSDLVLDGTAFREAALPLALPLAGRGGAELLLARASEPPMPAAGAEFAIPVELRITRSDRWAIDRGYVSLTPLRLDRTDVDALATARTKYPLD